MGDKVVRVDFANRKRVTESSDTYAATTELRSVPELGRPALIGRTALVTARLEMARARGDVLELEDLAQSLGEHTAAFRPGLNPAEVNEISRQANQILNELMGTEA